MYHLRVFDMYKSALLLVLFLAVHGCASTRHAAGLHDHPVTSSLNLAARHPAEWGKVVTRKAGCIDLTGEYTVVPVPSGSNADAGPLGKGQTLGDLMGLQSHNWPLRYPLATRPYVIIRGSHDPQPVDLVFHVETEPFPARLVNFQCIDGWIRTLNEYELGGRGDYLGDVYLSRTESGDLIMFYRSWVRNTALLGISRYVERGDYWFLFKRVSEHN